MSDKTIITDLGENDMPKEVNESCYNLAKYTAANNAGLYYAEATLKNGLGELKTFKVACWPVEQSEEALNMLHRV